jgi:dihydrofolate reductase
MTDAGFERQTNIPLAIVVAMASNRAIGKDGDLPWRLSDDLKWFKQVTLGKPVIMGRKTFQSIGKALPGRDNIVITRNAAFSAENITVARDLEDAISIAEAFAIAREVSEICIIGGGQIYEQVLPLAATLYLTQVAAEVADADAFFPALTMENWSVEEKARISLNDKNDHDAVISVLSRQYS